MKTISKVVLGGVVVVALSLASANSAQARGDHGWGRGDHARAHRQPSHEWRLSCGPRFSVGYSVYVPPPPVYYGPPPPVYYAPPPPVYWVPPPRVYYYYSRGRCDSY